jgi:hypothetical protein
MMTVETDITAALYLAKTSPCCIHFQTMTGKRKLKENYKLKKLQHAEDIGKNTLMTSHRIRKDRGKQIRFTQICI